MAELYDVIPGFNLFVKEVGVDKKALNEALEEYADDYLLEIPTIRQLMKERLILKSRVTYFVGENGSGKSTLIEAIATALKFNAEGGDKNTIFETNETHSILGECMDVARGNHPTDGYFLRAESFYNVASYIEKIGSSRYGDIGLHEQSHGESFLALVSNRLVGNGLYIFDEPEAALSPSRLMTLMCHMHELEKTNSQFIISTHSPILMSYPGAEIFELSDKGIKKIEYKDTEHYRITKDFIDKPEIMFKHLFGENTD